MYRLNIALLTDSVKMPNIALMKIAAYHKLCGDFVDWFVPLFAHTYDKIYYSKIFSFSHSDYECFLQGNVDKGGTGFDISKQLPDEIDTLPCDYSLYPNFDYAIGFITRGCIRHCAACVVPQKEGDIKPYRKIEDIIRPDSNKIVLLDNNILASDFGLSEIEKLAHLHYYIDFNQGLDARLITPEIAALLARVKYIRYLRIACDNKDMIASVTNAVEHLRNAGYRREIFCYALIKDLDEAYKRIMTLEGIGVTPFAQPFIDYNTIYKNESRLLKELARWVNRRWLFKSCTFQEYLKKQKAHPTDPNFC